MSDQPTETAAQQPAPAESVFAHLFATLSHLVAGFKTMTNLVPAGHSLTGMAAAAEQRLAAATAAFADLTGAAQAAEKGDAATLMQDAAHAFDEGKAAVEGVPTPQPAPTDSSADGLNAAERAAIEGGPQPDHS